MRIRRPFRDYPKSPLDLSLRDVRDTSPYFSVISVPSVAQNYFLMRSRLSPRLPTGDRGRRTGGTRDRRGARRHRHNQGGSSGPVHSRPGRNGEALLATRLGDLIRDGPHLPAAGSGGNDEVIRGGRQTPQVQDHDVRTMPLLGDFRRRDRELFCFLIRFSSRQSGTSSL